AETEKGRVSSTDVRPFESPGKVDDEDNCSVSRLLEQTEPRTRQLSHAGSCGGEEALSSLLAGTRRLAVASERARDRRQGRRRGDAQPLAQAPDRAVPRGEGTQRIDSPGRDERRCPGDRTGRHGKEEAWSSAEVVRQATW